MPERALVFDLVGTLLDVGRLSDAWDGLADRRLGWLALDDALAQAMVDTLTGVFRPFPELVEAGLRRQAAQAGLGDAPVPRAMAMLPRLPPYPDAAEALALARDAGWTVCVLTNSARERAQAMLDAAGLAGLVDRVDGADACGVYKPDPRIYALGPDPAGNWFVAGHWWDVAGAKRAGYRTAWVGRDDGPLMTTVPPPDVVAGDLVAAVSAALGR
ncbi:MAG TPA: HAD family hydrolase [Baekduia sp.]|nr:HAD family hydrolase [Baekduia sp.]